MLEFQQIKTHVKMIRIFIFAFSLIFLVSSCVNDEYPHPSNQRLDGRSNPSQGYADLYTISYELDQIARTNFRCNQSDLERSFSHPHAIKQSVQMTMKENGES